MDISLNDVDFGSFTYTLGKKQKSLCRIWEYRRELSEDNTSYKSQYFFDVNKYTDCFDKDCDTTFYGEIAFCIGKIKVNNKFLFVIASVRYIKDFNIKPLKDTIVYWLSSEIKEFSNAKGEIWWSDNYFLFNTDFQIELRYNNGALIDLTLEKFKCFNNQILEKINSDSSIIFTDKEYNALIRHDFDNCKKFGTYIPKIEFLREQLGIGWYLGEKEGRYAITIKLDNKKYLLPIFFYFNEDNSIKEDSFFGKRYKDNNINPKTRHILVLHNNGYFEDVKTPEDYPHLNNSNITMREKPIFLYHLFSYAYYLYSKKFGKYFDRLNIKERFESAIKKTCKDKEQYEFHKGIVIYDETFNENSACNKD